MATTSAADRRNQVMVGELPEDFLRVSSSPVQQQIAADEQAAAVIQAQQGGVNFMAPNLARLTITLTQAKLAKNYGLTRMDPYCRVRVGHSVFETHTATNGGKNPRWNKSLHCYLPQGVDSIYVEIFDERAFTTDNRVGWAHVSIPSRVFDGETVDDWYALNGKQGDGKEGMLNVIMSYSMQSRTAPISQPIVYTNTVPSMQPVVMMPGMMPVYYGGQPGVGVGGVPVPVTQPPPQHVPVPQQQPLQITDEDVKQVKDVFPNVDDEVIRSLLEANRGNKERTINNLLSMDS